MTRGTGAVDTALARYAAAVTPAMARYVPAREPRRHLYDMLGEFARQPGKGIRAALCLAACEAFGGTLEEALRPAVAVELLHAAFLIHDDIEDGSERRRGHATLHVEHGVPLALNAGDALAALCFRPLLDAGELLGSRMTKAITGEFHHAMERTVEGQAVEIGWRVENALDLSPLDYVGMVLKKTCAYTTILPLRVGCMIGSWREADLDPVTRFGASLGVAFQIQDDVLDLVSPEARYGKDVYGDVRERKRTLALIHALRVADPDDRAFIASFMDSTLPAEHDAVERVVDVMKRCGSIEFATEYAARVATEAHELFGPAFARCPASPAVEFLRELVPFMVERHR
jgi:geranylgeranyl diphosphate synthase, type II